MDNYLKFFWNKSSMNMITRKKEQGRKKSVEGVGQSQKI